MTDPTELEIPADDPAPLVATAPPEPETTAASRWLDARQRPVNRWAAIGTTIRTAVIARWSAIPWSGIRSRIKAGSRWFLDSINRHRGRWATGAMAALVPGVCMMCWFDGEHHLHSHADQQPEFERVLADLPTSALAPVDHLATTQPATQTPADPVSPRRDESLLRLDGIEASGATRTAIDDRLPRDRPSPFYAPNDVGRANDGGRANEVGRPTGGAGVQQAGFAAPHDPYDHHAPQPRTSDRPAPMAVPHSGAWLIGTIEEADQRPALDPPEFQRAVHGRNVEFHDVADQSPPVRDPRPTTPGPTTYVPSNTTQPLIIRPN